MLLTLASVWAADLHGPTPPPVVADPAAPLRSFTPQRFAGGVVGGALFELAQAPAVRFEQQGSQVTEQPLLDDVFGANLSVLWGAHERVGVGLVAPAFSAGLGDVQLHAPVTLVLPRWGGGGTSLALLPSLRLPTGGSLLSDGFGGGGRLALSSRGSRLGVVVNSGVTSRAASDVAFLTTGPTIDTSAGLSLRVAEPVVLHGEVVSSYGLDADPVGGRTLPAEWTLGVRGKAGPVWWGLSGGRVLSGGVGASPLRILGGLGVALDTREVVVPTVTFVATSAVGDPLAGVDVLQGDDVLGQTDASGSLVLPEPILWGRGLSARMRGFATSGFPQAGDDGRTEAVLEWLPVPLVVSVRDQRGGELDAEVRLEGEGAPPLTPSGDGTWSADVPRGTYTLVTAAPGKGTQRRRVQVDPGRTEPLAAEAVLADSAGDGVLVLELVDGEARPVDEAPVLLDGLPLGSTAPGGHVEIEGLAAGTHALDVRAHGFRPIERDVAIGGDPASLSIAMVNVAGSVRVVVTGPDGPVSDAYASFVGDTRHPRVELGPGGRRLFVLTPGEWTLVVSSAAFGIQERSVVLPPDQLGVVEVVVQLQPGEDGPAGLYLRVVDRDGEPVDAEVSLDGRSFGRTATGGTLYLRELQAGPRQLTIARERLQPLEHELLLVEGYQEHDAVVRWIPGAVRLRVRSDDGPVSDCIVRCAGPMEVPRFPVGLDGIADFTLPAGSWDIVGTSEIWGLAAGGVQVSEDSDTLHTIDLAMSAAEDAATVDVRVTGPAGQPVSGAVITVDGEELGRTSTGGRLSGAFAPGWRKVEVQSPLHRYAKRSVKLRSGRTEKVTVPLSWGTGAVRVRALSADGPVADASVILSSPDGQMPSVSLGTDGERVVAAGPGEWQAVVVSPSLGMQVADLEVSSRAGLTKLDVLMGDHGAGAHVLFRARDPYGKPVPGATVVAGDVERQTRSGGAAFFDGLEPGAASFAVSAPNFRPTTLTADLREGIQERWAVLQYVPVPVDVAVTDYQDAAVAATIRSEGPVTVPAVTADASGAASMDLVPGTWQVLASAEGYGVQRAELVVEPGADRQRVALKLFPARVGVTAGQVVIYEQVHFATGKATIRDDSDPVLVEVANTLLAYPAIRRVEVQGHTDSVGSIATNQALSDRRASAVREALVARGVSPDRLVARGYGPTRPVASNEDEAGKQKNRRVQFEILEVTE